MGDNQKTVTLPRGWPSGACWPPHAVIERMTQSEVTALIADVRHEVEFLAAWNDQRGEGKPIPDFFAGPFPTREQYAWNIKTR
jgi:hypothetical protein